MAFFWILLVAGIVGAWYLGYYTRLKRYTNRKLNLPRDYLVGLNFLLNEEPDKAVDVFIKMLEVDSDTVETHLAVGKLFRRRGEVDRAIRIHQNLIARPQLNKTYRDQSLFELGQDYLSAGVLDRAERIFLELLNVKDYSVRALRALLDIYQQEKAWENAIEMAFKLAAATKKSTQPMIAHYYCELAETVMKKGQNELAKEYLQQALETDSHCVRASLMLAKSDMKKGDHKSAIKVLKRIKEQNPDFLSEAIDSLAQCYEALDEKEKIIHYVQELADEHPRIPVVLILAERLKNWHGDQVAASFVADYVRRYPSIHGIHLYVDLYLANTDQPSRDDIRVLQNLTQKLLVDKPKYQCTSCGFAGKTLHWHCPGCKQWNSVQPLHSLPASLA